MKLSILFFSAEFRDDDPNSYELVLEAARFADAHGFHAVWLPERHFHPFGGIYPNPAIIAGVIASQTRRLRIRSGSVVLPLHHPVRVAEDWAMVDRLSGGRVDLSFSKGWNKSEFIFRTDVDGYDDDRMFSDIATVRSLWGGEEQAFPTAAGEERRLSVYPRPMGGPLSFWVSTFNEALYERTAREGGNILTGLLLQSPNQLKEKITSFRNVAAPGAQLSLMMHTFVGADDRHALDVVGAPFRAYLENSMTLWKQQEPRLEMSEAARQKVLDFAYARYLKESTLIGGIEQIAARLRFFESIGVDEVACLLDFGAPPDEVLNSLKRLATLIRTDTASYSPETILPEPTHS